MGENIFYYYFVSIYPCLLYYFHFLLLHKWIIRIKVSLMKWRDRWCVWGGEGDLVAKKLTPWVNARRLGGWSDEVKQRMPTGSQQAHSGPHVRLCCPCSTLVSVLFSSLVLWSTWKCTQIARMPLLLNREAWPPAQPHSCLQTSRSGCHLPAGLLLSSPHLPSPLMYPPLPLWTFTFPPSRRPPWRFLDSTSDTVMTSPLGLYRSPSFLDQVPLKFLCLSSPVSPSLH